MKRALFLLFATLLSVLSVHAEIPDGTQVAVMAGYPGRMGPVASRQNYTPEAQAIFNAFTTPPTEARKALINTTVAALKTSGVWPLLDALQVYAAADSQAARVDWRVPSRVATAVNSPAFTVDRGFLPNGSTSYIDTNFQPASGPNFGINGHTFGCRTNSDLTAQNWVDLGNLDNAIGPYAADTSVSVRSSSSSSVAGGTGVPSSRLNVVLRTDAAGGATYYADNTGALSLISTFGRTAATLDNTTTMFAGGRNNGSPTSMSSRQNSMIFAGGQMTVQQLTDFSAIMHTYMVSVGNTN